MPPLSEEEQRLVWDRIDSRLKELGMTQAGLAEKIGIAAESISKYKNGKQHADKKTLEDACFALGMTLEDARDPSFGCYVVRKRQSKQHPEENWTVEDTIEQNIKHTYLHFPHDEVLKAGFTRPLLQARKRLLGPGATTTSVTQHPGEEVCFVISGEVEITVESDETNKVYTLTAGDLIHFRAMFRHYAVNKSAKPAEILLVHTPPVQPLRKSPASTETEFPVC